MYSKTNHEMSFLLLNVCGLTNKLEYPDFIEFIKKYDFICFVESNTDDIDAPTLPGYVVKMKSCGKEIRRHCVGGKRGI